MTHNVSSGTLNPAVTYLLLLSNCVTFRMCIPFGNYSYDQTRMPPEDDIGSAAFADTVCLHLLLKGPLVID